MDRKYEMPQINWEAKLPHNNLGSKPSDPKGSQTNLVRLEKDSK